ncbi:hypothetical protein VNO78_08000 [Psophocarpus tetragonolobus]|uniref:Uncharacterized protein n=1 Tax=Psophocarpus tetragonolobus TaxID=3891 RepID=A0AAN9SUD4_PSOTE
MAIIGRIPVKHKSQQHLWTIIVLLPHCYILQLAAALFNAAESLNQFNEELLALAASFVKEGVGATSKSSSRYSTIGVLKMTSPACAFNPSYKVHTGFMDRIGVLDLFILMHPDSPILTHK